MKEESLLISLNAPLKILCKIDGNLGLDIFIKKLYSFVDLLRASNETIIKTIYERMNY